MRFTVSSQKLGTRLSTLAKVINSKNSMPILDCFLFDVADGQMSITASDSENTMCTRVELDECEGSGSFCVSNRTLLDAVKELSEQPITFDVNLDTIQIKILYLNGMYNIVGLASDEYSKVLPLQVENTTITMESSVLAENISRSIFATAQDELRPIMNGIYFDLKEDSLSIVASDGHKLVRNMNFGVKSEQPMAFVLPKKPANLLKNVLAKDESDVVIRFDNRNAEITYAEGTLVCRLLEGRYPNYNSVIPQNNPNKMSIDRKGMLSALRRVLPFASDASQLVRLRIESGRLEISSEDLDFATSAKEELICEYEGRPMSIGFKGSTLTEVLNNLESEDVIVELSDPTRAGLIIPAVQPENEDVLMLLMPMLLND